MPKNIVIAEGTQGKTFTGVTKLKTALQGGGSQNWIPEDEAGSYVRLITKTIRDNGEYVASQDNATGYKSVKVNIKPKMETRTFTTNGTYEAEDYGADGFSRVTVQVSGGSGTLKTKKITYNGVYRAADEGAEGYSAVRVEIGDIKPDAGIVTSILRGIVAPYVAGKVV